MSSLRQYILVIDDRNAISSWKKTKKRDERVARERAVLRLNIPPLKNHCMSPCNQNCELLPPIAFVLTLLPTHPTSS